MLAWQQASGALQIPAVVPPVTEPLPHLSCTEASHFGQVFNLTLSWKLVPTEATFQCRQLLMGLLVFVDAGIKEGLGGDTRACCEE